MSPLEELILRALQETRRNPERRACVSDRTWIVSARLDSSGDRLQVWDACSGAPLRREVWINEANYARSLL